MRVTIFSPEDGNLCLKDCLMSHSPLLTQKTFLPCGHQCSSSFVPLSCIKVFNVNIVMDLGAEYLFFLLHL